MATIVVVFKILFLVLIAHSFVATGVFQHHQASSGDEFLAPATAIATETVTSRQIRARRQNQPERDNDSTTPENQPGGDDTVVGSIKSDREETAALVPSDHEIVGSDPLVVSTVVGSDNNHQLPLETKPQLRIGPSATRSSGPIPTPSPAAPSTTMAINYAELCYLSNGGSSLTLTVNEATQVGSIIGTVDVNGDPSLEGGNVNLFDALEPQQWSQTQLQSANRTQTNEHQSVGNELHSNHLSKQRRLLKRRSTEMFQNEEVQIQQNKLAHRSPARLLGLVSEHQHQASGSAVASSSSGSYYSLVANSVSSQGSTAQQPPVRLLPGTRNLILVRSLDKESVEGEQSLVINVRCSPRSPVSAESTTIPVRLIVTDANDHAPEFVGQLPYVVNISETAPIGFVVSRDILAQDRDSAGPHSTLHYRVLEDGSPHSTLLQFANPLDPTLVVAGQLDYETLASFTVTIVAQDQGEPEPLSASTQVQVNIIDFDDQNPRFMDDKYTLIMDDAQQNLVGQNLQVLPRNLYAEDGDKGINAPIVYSFDQLGNLQQPATATSGSDTSTSGLSIVGGDDQLTLNIERYLHLNPTSGEIRLIRQWPSNLLNAPVTLVVRATQADNKDRYTLTTLTISKPPAPLSSNSQARNNLARARQQHDNSTAIGKNQGIEFTPDRLSINVPENVPINEKIARVRARYSAGGEPVGSKDSADGQSVDLVHESTIQPTSGTPNASNGASRLSRVRGGGGGNNRDLEQPLMLHNSNKRPIHYQILDDQTDQFGINGLGEIFVKRALDYELKQEYKFRVLATYTKYSDICQVQVNVQNVNDNKPKFTQPQYNFHVTETKLRSNVIGQVQAHDADLNDTVRYSLAGDQAHLFEVSSGGQISLKPSIRQLNISAFQLNVQAYDTLTTGGHSAPAQARVNIHVSPQLVGRSLSLEPSSMDKRQVDGTGNDGKLTLNTRSSDGERGWTATAGGRRFTLKGSGDEQEQLLSSTSSKDPLASNQRSSVATVVSSLQHMVRGSNLLDMPMSSALVLSAVLALLICLLFIILISMSAHLYRRRAKSRQRQHLAAASRLRQAQLAAAGGAAAAYQQSPVSQSAISRYQATKAAGAPLTSSSASISSSPTNSTAAGGSPSYLNSPRHHLPQVKSKSAQGVRLSDTQQQPPRLDTISGHLSAKNGCTSQLDSGSCKQGTQDKQLPAEFSLVSSLSSSQSKRSYQSNTTDDSSVMHCGHYSINASRQLSPNNNINVDGNLQQQHHHQQPASTNSDIPAKDVVDTTAQQVVMGAADSLMNYEQENDGRASNKSRSPHQPVPKTTKSNELSGLTSGRPGIKSYRKLPPLGSLARPIKSLTSANSSDTCDNVNTVQENGSEDSNRKQGLMAMIRDPEQRKFGNNLQQRPNSSTNHLPQRHPTLRSPSPQQSREIAPAAAIKWPQDSAPLRVKKLTWDDELSVANEPDCFVAPDLPPLGGPISPLGSQHHYPIDQLQTGKTTQDESDGQFVEQQHFLFSNPCSPVPGENIMMASPGTGEEYSMLPPLVTEIYGSGGGSGEQHHSSIMGQNNCFDYTIVQSSQFSRPDTGQQQILSGQHHLLQQQQTKWPPASRTSYLYSSSNINSLSNHQATASIADQSNQQRTDLRLLTAAAL